MRRVGGCAGGTLRGEQQDGTRTDLGRIRGFERLATSRVCGRSQVVEANFVTAMCDALQSTLENDMVEDDAGK